MTAVLHTTFGPVTGWLEVELSLRTILTTPRGSRVMRREFGMNFAELLDRPQNSETMLRAYLAIVEAIEPREIDGYQYGEPRFDLVQMTPYRVGADGGVGFDLVGLHYPGGLVGDFSRVERADLRVLVEGL